MATQPLELPSFDGTLGCMFLACIFSSVLWGVGCVQVYLYFETHAKRDRLWLKCYVVAGWLLDTLHAIFLLQPVYVYLIKDIGNLAALSKPERLLVDTDVIAAIIDLQVQLLFIFRAWTLSEKNLLVVLPLLLLVSGQFAAGIVYYVQFLHSTSTVSNAHVTTIQVATAIGSVSDSAVALTIVYLLRRRRSHFAKTSSILNRIMVYVVGTGLITGIWSFMGMLASILWNNLIFALILEALPKVYFNCMLTSLNMRTSLREANMGTNELELSNVSSTSSGKTPRVPGLVDVSKGVEVRIEHSQSFDPPTLNEPEPSISSSIHARTSEEIKKSGSTI